MNANKILKAQIHQQKEELAAQKLAEEALAAKAAAAADAAEVRQAT